MSSRSGVATLNCYTLVTYLLTASYIARVAGGQNVVSECSAYTESSDATYGCESWTLRKNEEMRLDTFEMRELLDTVKARKLEYYGHTMRKQGSCLEKEIMQGTIPGARRRGRQCTAWMDNIKTWTGLSVEESIRMTEDRDKRRKYVHGVTNPRIEDG